MSDAAERYRTGDDRVQIRLGDDDVHICTSYEVRTGIFDQPSTFSVQIANGRIAASLLQRYPGNTPFQLIVGDAPQFSGYTEGREAQGNASSGTEIGIHGRSVLAGLLSDVKGEKTFTGSTHRQMVENAIAELHLLRPFGGGSFVQVLSTNTENTDARTAAVVRSQQEITARNAKAQADHDRLEATRQAALDKATQDRLAAQVPVDAAQKRYDTLLSSIAHLPASASSPAVKAEVAKQRSNLAKLKFILADRVAAEQKLTTKNPDAAVILAGLAGSVGNDLPHLRAKLGEKWMDLLRKHLELAGLFLWDSHDGNIVVAQPNTSAPPMGQILKLGAFDRDGNFKATTSTAESWRWREDFASRFSEVNIWSRSTGVDYGRGDVNANYHDRDMESLGFNRLKVIHGKHVTSPAQAQALAHRALFAGQRQGFALEYTVKGHSTISMQTGDRVVWAPDTTVDVIDQELGITGTYYVETVTHTRSERGTHTKLTLLPPASMVFGEESDQ